MPCHGHQLRSGVFAGRVKRQGLAAGVGVVNLRGQSLLSCFIQFLDFAGRGCRRLFANFF